MINIFTKSKKVTETATIDRTLLCRCSVVMKGGRGARRRAGDFSPYDFRNNGKHGGIERKFTFAVPSIFSRTIHERKLRSLFHRVFHERGTFVNYVRCSVSFFTFVPRTWFTFAVPLGSFYERDTFAIYERDYEVSLTFVARTWFTNVITLGSSIEGLCSWFTNVITYSVKLNTNYGLRSPFNWHERGLGTEHGTNVEQAVITARNHGMTLFYHSFYSLMVNGWMLFRISPWGSLTAKTHVITVWKTRTWIRFTNVLCNHGTVFPIQFLNLGDYFTNALCSHERGVMGYETPSFKLDRFKLEAFELEGDNELRRVARLFAKLDAFVRHLIAKPRVFDLDYFLDILSNIQCVVIVIGNPGTGKTEYLSKIIRGDAKVCNGTIPTPGLGLAFTNADMAELNRRVGDVYEFRINTLHAEAVGSVGIKSMIGYAIEVPGTKRVVRIRRGGYEYIQEFVDIALAQERLRATIARVVGLPYSMDPFIESLGNRVFHVFDIYVHTQGVSDIEGLINKLWEFDPRLSRAVKLYIDCLAGKVSRVGDINCSPAFDFTTVLPELLRSSIPAVNGGIIHSLVIDEYQDWSPLMNAILANWVRYVDCLVVAGDPDQLIYHSLNGAREDAFLSVYKAVKEGRVKGEIIHLSQSHRVLEPLNRLAVGVLRKYTKPQDWDNWGGRSEGSVPFIHVKTWGQVRDELLDLYNNNKLRKYFILAPVNAGVLYAYQVPIEPRHCAVLPEIRAING